MPILVGQGLADALVVPRTTTAYVDRVCAAGELVDYRTYEGIDHGLIAERLVPALIPWLHDRVTGAPAPATCSTASVPAPTGSTVGTSR